MFVGNVGQDAHPTSRLAFRSPSTPPVFTQQPTIAVRVNRNGKGILGAAAGAGLAAVGVGVLVIIATWHGGPSPSPTARVAAPTAPAAAPTHIRSSQSPGGFLPLAAVIGEVSGDFQDTYGNPPERVECVGDLAGWAPPSDARLSITASATSRT